MACYVHRIDLSSGWIEVSIDYDYEKLTPGDRALLADLRGKFAAYEADQEQLRVTRPAGEGR